jgi:predicted Zn-dependent peptidase
VRRIAIVAACAAFLLGAAPAPSTTSSAGTTIVTQPDASVQLVGVSYFVRAGLDRQAVRQDGLAALTAETILRSSVTDGAALQDAVAQSGGSLSFTVEDGDVEFYLQSLSDRAAAQIALLAAALAKPNITNAAVNEARTRLVRRVALDGASPLQVGVEMLSTSADGTAMSLARYDATDVQAFYARAYKRGGSVISAIGNVTALPASALSQLAAALPGGTSKPVSHPAAPAATSHQIIAHRDIDAPWLVARYPAPKPGSRDFGAMLVLSAIVNSALAEVANVPGTISHSFASDSVGTMYDYGARPANLIVYMAGGMGDPTRTFGTGLAVIGALSTSKLQGSLATYKAQAQGRFVSDATSLHDRAWLAGEFALQGASTDYLNATLAQIAAVTPADVQRAARAYMGNPTVALVLPRSN